MIICTVDDTGEVFNTATELAQTIGCVPSYITYCMKTKRDAPDHFYCGEYGITILHHNDIRKENSRRRSKEYYRTHKDTLIAYAKKWRAEHKDQVKASKEKWRKEHKEWFNAYYREQRKRKKEQQCQN